MSPALETRGLCKSFGALAVTREVDLRLERGARHALIGPNGAGKTTLINLVTGVLKPSSGDILLEGASITHVPQAVRVRRGIARTFQISQLFRTMSVIENVALAISERRGAAMTLWRPLGTHREILDEAAERLHALRLLPEATRPVRELPYGRQRLVEIAIALSLAPKVLLLDEPAAGVPSGESHVITEAIEALDPEIAVLIIDHDMDLVFRLARRITVLVSGAVLTEGAPGEIADNPDVRTAYLGQTGLSRAIRA